MGSVSPASSGSKAFQTQPIIGYAWKVIQKEVARLITSVA
jgi:hypothetical protein